MRLVSRSQSGRATQELPNQLNGLNASRPSPARVRASETALRGSAQAFRASEITAQVVRNQPEVVRKIDNPNVFNEPVEMCLPESTFAMPKGLVKSLLAEC